MIRPTHLIQHDPHVLYEGMCAQALLIGGVLAVMQQWTGINAIMYYAPDIFRAAGAGQNASVIQTVHRE